MAQQSSLPHHAVPVSRTDRSLNGSMTSPAYGGARNGKDTLQLNPGQPHRTTELDFELSPPQSDYGMELLVGSTNPREVKSDLDLPSNFSDAKKNEVSLFAGETKIDLTQALESALSNLLSDKISSGTILKVENSSESSTAQQKSSIYENLSLPEIKDSEGYASVLTETVRPTLGPHGRSARSLPRPSVQQIQVPLYLTAPNRKTGIVNSTPLLYNSSTNPPNPHHHAQHHQHQQQQPVSDKPSDSLSPTLTKPVNKVDPIPSSEGAVKMPGASAVPPFVAGTKSEAPGTWTPGFSFSELEIATQERDKLLAQLEVQLKVNTDLKKLLVASVGEDLENRVEFLARDRAQLAVEVGDYSKRLHKDFEDLDRLSIQADMWRSKCMASRVMIDELTGMKAQMAMKFHECQHALQEMLQERHEVRANLQEIQSCLADLRDAFDPKHAQKFPNQEMGNVIDLARASRQLADAVRFRLLGSRPSSQALNVDLDTDDNLTAAEYHASQILSDEGIVQEKIQKEIPCQQYMDRYERFHPLTRYERLTINCCAKCNGEIKLI